VENESSPVRKNGFAVFDSNGVRKHAKRVAYYGAEDDCEVAVQLYYELQEAIQTMAIIRFASWAKGDGGAYCEGFVSGLKEANIKSIQRLKDTDTQTNALMLVSEQTQLAIRKGANEYLSKELNIKLRKGAGSQGAKGSGEARNEGMRDGRNYDAQRPGRTGKIG
jgi:hypothetical protein